MCTVDEVYEYGQDTFNVPERGEIRIEGCPSSIGDQLRHASFTQQSPGVFTKSHTAGCKSVKNFATPGSRIS